MTAAAAATAMIDAPDVIAQSKVKCCMWLDALVRCVRARVSLPAGVLVIEVLRL
jgi:hypothetical protein